MLYQQLESHAALVQELYALYAQHREKISDMSATVAAVVLQSCRDCNVDRTIKEISKSASPDASMKTKVSKAHRDLTKVLQQRQKAEAKRRGIDVTDLSQFSKARQGQLGASVEDGEKNKLHAANMVPRFGSDLGFTARGVQVRLVSSPCVCGDATAERGYGVGCAQLSAERLVPCAMRVAEAPMQPVLFQKPECSFLGCGAGRHQGRKGDILGRPLPGHGTPQLAWPTAPHADSGHPLRHHAPRQPRLCAGAAATHNR